MRKQACLRLPVGRQAYASTCAYTQTGKQARRHVRAGSPVAALELKKERHD